MIELYLIRHAESEDNLKGVWAGWKDSVLSNHGMRQAEALGASLSHVPFNAIYTSDLKRALSTAKVLRSAALCEMQDTPSCSLHVTPTLREQNFGVAEGTKIVKKNKELSLRAHYAKGLFPTLYARYESYPGGESLQDVRSRAEAFVEEMLMTLVNDHYSDQEEEKQKSSIVGVVSHGIFIGELVAALLRRGGSVEGNTDNFRGMRNTAWTKVEVHIEPLDPTQYSVLHDTHTLAQEPDIVSNSSLINLKVIARVIAVNRHPHLSNLHRQGGGIGSMAHDPKQQDIRKFLQVKHGRPVKKKVDPKEKSK